MSAIKKIVTFVLVFLIAGCAIHYATFRKFGVFIWSFEKNAESGETMLVKTSIPGSPDLAENDSQEEDGEKSATSGSDVKGGEQKKPAPKKDPNVISLYDGTDLGKWKKTEFGGEGDVFVNEDGNIEFGFGAILTGVHWGEEPPGRTNYELSLDAMRLDGNDFFLGLTFPVKEEYATFVLGGWGGGVVGISSIDDLDASENETMNIEGFEDDVWYKVRVRVTDEKLEAWIDDRQMADVELKDRKISLRPGDIELCVPIGIASFQVRSQYRNIVWKKIDPSKTEEAQKSKTNSPAPENSEEAAQPSSEADSATSESGN